MKICPSCKIEKPETDFNKDAGANDGLQGRCRPCSHEAHRKHKAKDPVGYNKKSNARFKKYKLAKLADFRKEDAARARRRRIRNPWKVRQERYDLTPAEFEAMLATQESRCKICLDPINLKSLHVDHNHETGKIRGLLCKHCNWGIGHFQDSQMRLLLAIQYLRANS